MLPCGYGKLQAVGLNPQEIGMKPRNVKHGEMEPGMTTTRRGSWTQREMRARRVMWWKGIIVGVRQHCDPRKSLRRKVDKKIHRWLIESPFIHGWCFFVHAFPCYVPSCVVSRSSEFRHPNTTINVESAASGFAFVRHRFMLVHKGVIIVLSTNQFHLACWGLNL